jgi:hypothetical protein
MRYDLIKSPRPGSASAQPMRPKGRLSPCELRATLMPTKPLLLSGGQGERIPGMSRAATWIAMVDGATHVSQQTTC